MKHLIYWKRGIYFGKTTEKGLKDLRDVDINVKTISSVYFHVLSFIKYMFMIILLPIVLVLMFINTLCKYISVIISIPINKYNRYF